MREVGYSDPFVFHRYANLVIPPRPLKSNAYLKKITKAQYETFLEFGIKTRSNITYSLKWWEERADD